MQISLANTVRMDVDIHISCAVFFINLFEAPKEFCAVILLESVGTKIFQNPLVALGDSVKGRLEGIVDCDFRILRFALLIDLHTGTFWLEAVRQTPPSHITAETKTILLFHGHKRKIPSDLPGM